MISRQAIGKLDSSLVYLWPSLDILVYCMQYSHAILHSYTVTVLCVYQFIF